MNDIAIIVPSLDPDKNLNMVVDGMSAAGFENIIIVDDGSDEDHKGPFRKAVEEHPGCTLLVHEVNRGKGCALKTAFSYILENMPHIAGAITIDGDGQHAPEDSVRVAEEMKRQPDNIVFGSRTFKEENVPFTNKMGNKITAGIFKLFFGMDLKDAQTGLRGFPRKYLKALTEVEGERYEYESNMLMYMSENKIPYSEVEIKTVYSEDNSGSHFNKWTDSIRIYKPILAKATSLKYVASSVAAAVVDLTAFTILNSIFKNVANIWIQTFLTTGIARLISATFNFTVNYKWVFKSEESGAKSAVKYAITALLHYGVAYVLCTLVFALAAKAGIVGFGRTILKLLVDVLLYVVTYKVQQIWVFKKP
ncbi:MAG: glycosyltransferase [Firmicutes bacterium]|nr:glycosyltransferase [Bacillota bacterium]